MRTLSVILTLLCLLAASCGLSDRYEIAFDHSNGTVKTRGAKISLAEEGNQYTATLTDRVSSVRLSWTVEDKNPVKWQGERFRGTHIKINNAPFSCEFRHGMVEILIEITDVTGRTVSGKFSGNIGIGESARTIDNGVFRAYVEL
ncbi:MAG TPA: hypothetical protein ENN75_01935 [candidate division Zixibacteria bacterium]|nr:hypothetical protein [candidate division Zixibacteria bacterium]